MFVARSYLSALRNTALVCLSAVAVGASELPAAAHFRRDIQPLLNEYCSDCHADGAKKGNVAFDEFKSDAEIVTNRELWLKALKNVQAGLMPPEKKRKPSADEIQKLMTWIKSDVFTIDP